MNLDLKAFVVETLASICEGVAEASERVGDLGDLDPAIANAHQSLTAITDQQRQVSVVSFDVSVVVDESAAKSRETGASGEVGGKIPVLMVGAEAEVRIGNQNESSRSSSAANRIRFQVPLVLTPRT